MKREMETKRPFDQAEIRPNRIDVLLSSQLTRW